MFKRVADEQRSRATLATSILCMCIHMNVHTYVCAAAVCIQPLGLTLFTQCIPIHCVPQIVAYQSLTVSSVGRLVEQ